MNDLSEILNSDFIIRETYDAVRNSIINAQNKVYNAVNSAMVEAYWETHLPSAVWIMLNTWTHMFSAMNMEQNEGFHSFLGMNGLTPQQGPKRLEILDHFLEQVDDTIDSWGKSHGLEDGTSIYIE